MQKSERISCAALLVVVDGIELAIPLQHQELPMDRINYLMKHVPTLAQKCDTNCYYITSRGRVVDNVEAMTIAISANQLVDDTIVKRQLNPFDLWPRKK